MNGTTIEKENVVGIYHGGCIDGTTSAAVLLRRFPSAQVFPLSHGFTDEDLELIKTNIPSDTSSTIIYTIDCALGVEYFLNLGYQVVTLDHHITGKEYFESLAKTNPRYTFVFDITKSGSSLAWSYFFPNLEVPRVVTLVEDGDLWTLKYGDETKGITNYLSILRGKPEEVLPLFEGIPADVTLTGKIISDFSATLIEHYTSKAQPLILNIGEHKAQVYNITDFQSDCGSILSRQNSCAVGLFSIKGDQVRFSFRSTDENSPSALDLATVLGGGGHRNSAGARLPLKDFFSSLEL